MIKTRDVDVRLSKKGIGQAPAVQLMHLMP